MGGQFKRVQNSRQFSSSELSPQLFTPSHLFDTCRHTRSFRQRKALVGGHWNFPKRKGKTGQDKLQQLTDTQQRSTDCTHCTLQDFHQSCPHSRPPRHTSRRGACTKCCCTGTHPQDSDAQLGSTGRNRKCFMAAVMCEHL